MRALRLHLRRISLVVFALLFVFLDPSQTQAAITFVPAEEKTNKEKAHLNITHTGGGGELEACTEVGGEAGDLDRFLQVLADQESGGNPTAQNPISSASGKYQYITDTWRSRVSGLSALYPPGAVYAVAKDAPESVQDAVAYIEYSKKFAQYGGDVFKLAVSHFYPAALENESLLDATIGSNTITPREYGESIVSKIQAGVGKAIPLLYTEAPEFEKYSTSTVPVGETSSAPVDPAVASCDDNFAGGDLTQTVLAYAWPEYHPAPYTNMRPAYQKAVIRAQSQGRYVGGGIKPGIDCGGFVTTLLFDSGFDTSYNHDAKGGNTPIQEAWVKANWKSLGAGSSIDTGSLQPGDVAFSGGPSHTFVFVGEIAGFKSNIASASYSTTGQGWRTPMAGSESLTAGDIRWYRKKS